MGFVVEFPSGWKVVNSRASVTAQTSGGDQAMQLTLVKPSPAPTSPEDYVRRLGTQGKILGADGQTETIGSYPAWTGQVTVQDQNGARGTLLAGFLEKERGSLFQFLGVPAGARNVFLSSVRSFRALTDPAKLSAEPDRVAVLSGGSGTLQSFLKTVPSLALPEDQIAWLNNLDLGTSIGKSTLVKVVQKGKH
jgi:predicted Zn-dependent protease